ncbi:MAG: response regulator transcription factor [Odoribacteraceae bacterium]|jgi:DNA-binding NarL/FixJ family response regulator|nr:response regulator transcription factor [Odoribacteraceae bacterium]
MTRAVELFIVDDHKLFREGLKLLLSTRGFENHVHEASNGLEFTRQLAIVPCDVALVDIEMPVMNGIDATVQAMKIRPSLKVIVLSMFGDEQYYYRMIDAGARGFMLKDSGIDKVVDAIREVAAGGNYFSPGLLAGLLDRRRGAAPGDVTAAVDITGRELQVLFHICRGLSNQEIADELFISKRTVDKHRANLLCKTRCRNTAALVMYAIRHKIIDA